MREVLFDRSMTVCHFTSESYPAVDRAAAWDEILRSVGLRVEALPPADVTHARASRRAFQDEVEIARLAAGPQVLTPLLQRADLPILFMPLEDGGTLEAAGLSRALRARQLMLLPRQTDWSLTFDQDFRALILSVRASLFRGRKIGTLDFGEARSLSSGLAHVLAAILATGAKTLDEMRDDEWACLAQSLAEMTLTLSREPVASASEACPTTTQAALLSRISQTIERRLADPGLTPARVAHLEGISERYLQKLFESIGDNFTHYLRERRLQRSWADLANPAEAHHSVSEIAFRCGFSDAAHFSRAFRDKFGLSPRAFRQQQETERLKTVAAAQSQRGWPPGATVSTQTPSALLQAGRNAPASHKPGSTATQTRHHHLPVDAARVHWGFFSRALLPVVEVASGDTITVETLSQHASDDSGRMIAGDPGAESVFHWTADRKGVERRGAGPMDASIYGRGAGEGFGVHICTGPIAVADAEPGDVLEVRILDLVPRPSQAPSFAGRVFGSSAAAWWGYHYGELLAEPKPREVVTIYEIFADGEDPHARALYSYRWTPQTDPYGIVHQTYDYPGVKVATDQVERRIGVLRNLRIPLRPHFGVIGVAPREAGLVDSVPPAYFGGNLDNWRLGKGSTVYLPVSVAGALLSIGDPHAAQGDGEVAGTAIECSMTGTLQVVLHKKPELSGTPLADLTYPLIETETDWVLTGFSHPNHLAEFGAKGQSEVYAQSSLDLAMKDAFRKMRRFLMASQGLSEDEAIALMSAAVDFGVTQVVDGNWGVHAILSKRLFASKMRS